MALTVEDGTGLLTADSYLSVANTDTYHTAHGDPLNWEQQETTRKEEALRQATRYLDIVYRTYWKGRRLSRDQSLAWPRTDVVDEDSFGLDSDELPAALLDACAELAIRDITETNGLLPDISTSRNIVEEKKKIEGLEKITKYQGSRPTIPRFRIVEHLLTGILRSTQVERA